MLAISAGDPLIEVDPLAGFDLTPDQRQAAMELDRNVLLSAGAGTGKTRTLVGRYVYLLSHGFPVRDIVAITFTDKAAREMRNRIRSAIAHLAVRAGPAAPVWADLETQLDAARIGTIHSLCAEILRTNPVEAGLDPGFEVIEEGLSLTFKARAVSDALGWAVEQPVTAELYRAFSPNALSTILAGLMDRRLDATELFASGSVGQVGDILLAMIDSFLRLEPVAASFEALERLEADGELESDAGPTLAPRVGGLLRLAAELEAALKAGQVEAALALLFRIRREGLQKLGGGAKSRARTAVHELQALYDLHLDSWIGGSDSEDLPPSGESDTAWGDQIPRLKALFDYALGDYRRALDGWRGLDFDDLEVGALRLLEMPAIAEQWRDRVRSVLVDEFQDTNERQRRIIDALVGDRSGSLFAVGDARQSIYRFRGADVRVFLRKRHEILAGGGLAPEIDLSFRAHAPLHSAIDDLLGPLLGGEPGDTLYQIPYVPLAAQRLEPGPSGGGPHLEFVLGAAQRAEAARGVAAQALCNRLVELEREGVVSDWGQVALLFRASTGFEPYEQALEAAGIPFVTVAGRGFFQRPEIRDLINALRAITDPNDDLALAGFLRSPAIGLSDPGLYKLRANGDSPGVLFSALADAERRLEPTDRAAAAAAWGLLAELHPLADRLPVAELISRLVARLDWRAMLATAHARLWRNVDKLVEDALASEQIHVSAFLEYLSALRDVGAREGEAPAAEGGTVQLMTIHKAKGLEFDHVVLADASRQRPRALQPVYLFPEIGPAAPMDRIPGEPSAYRLSRAIDAGQSEAEERRLLYVAATRARERVIVSGYLSQPRGTWAATGWLKSMLEVLRLNPASLSESSSPTLELRLPGGQRAAVRTLQGGGTLRWESPGSVTAWPDSTEAPLYPVVAPQPKEVADPDLGTEPERTWRATGSGRRAPAVAVGRMVHAAIQRRAFPRAEGYGRFVENEAYRAGLVAAQQREAAIEAVTEMLERLAQHPLWAEILAAEVARHELPFVTSSPSGQVQSGQIDLLWQTREGWKIVDFKTDSLRDPAELAAAIDRHRGQVERYVRSAANILGSEPTGSLCFLDAFGGIRLVDLQA